MDKDNQSFPPHQWSIMFGNGEQYVVRGETFDDVWTLREEIMKVIPVSTQTALAVGKSFQKSTSSNGGGKTRTEIPCVVCGMPALRTSGTNARGEWWAENCKSDKSHARNSWS